MLAALTWSAGEAAAKGGGGGRSSGPSAGKTVHVNGYTRKDGTYVQSHWRSPPGSGRSSGGPTSSAPFSFSVPDPPASNPKPKTSYRSDARTESRSAARYSAPAAPLPPPVPNFTLSPKTGRPIPIGSSPEILGSFVKARAIKDWPTVISMTDRGIAGLVDTPTNVEAEGTNNSVRWVRMVDGPYAGKTWVIDAGSLAPLQADVVQPGPPELPEGAEAWVVPQRERPGVLGMSLQILNWYVEAAGKDDRQGMATWADRGMVQLVDEPLPVHIEKQDAKTATVRPVRGPHAVRSWVVLLDDLSIP